MKILGKHFREFSSYTRYLFHFHNIGGWLVSYHYLEGYFVLSVYRKSYTLRESSSPAKQLMDQEGIFHDDKFPRVQDDTVTSSDLYQAKPYFEITVSESPCPP